MTGPEEETPDLPAPPAEDDLMPTDGSENAAEPVPDAEGKDGDEGDGDEGDGEEGKDGKGGKSGGGGKKPSVDVKLDERLLSEEELEDYDPESLIERLKLLVWAPLSTMVPGASAFESESDLKRKLFLGQVGILTNEIQPNDIADPDLVAKLEKRSQARQDQIKAEQVKMVAAAASVAAAAVSAILPPSVDELQQQKLTKEKQAEIKQQIGQPKEASVDARKEIETDKPDAEQRAKQERKPDLADEYVASKKEDIGYPEAEKEEDNRMDFGDVIDMLDDKKTENEFGPADYSKQVEGPTGFDKIMDFFNTMAQKTEAVAPDQKTTFKLPDPAPKMDAPPPMGS